MNSERISHTINSSSLQSSNKTEIIAGITSFLTMVYIVFVNPTILNIAGLDKGSVFTATCLVSGIACLLTGIFAKTPVGIAPGMALNIYFTYSVVLGSGVSWQHALAMVFISGLLFLLISFTKLRRLLLEAIPHNLQIAILIGISLLISIISLETNNIIIKNEYTVFSLGDLATKQSILFWGGFLFLLVLDYYRVYGAIIINILGITFISYLLGLTNLNNLVSLPPSISPTFLKLDFSHIFDNTSIKIIFTFLFITVFDASGTLLGIFNQPMFSKSPTIKSQLSKTLSINAAATTLAGLLGSSSTSPFIESAAGIQAGGRKGLTAIIIGIGFLLTLFFFPLAQIIPNFAVGPALLYVACCMLKNVDQLKLSNISETAPCLFTILFIPFTASITDGIGGGLILYVALKLIVRERIHPLTVILGIIFLMFFMFAL